MVEVVEVVEVVAVVVWAAVVVDMAGSVVTGARLVVVVGA